MKIVEKIAAMVVMFILAASVVLIIAAATAHAETVLLRFHATWCPPCRQMERVWGSMQPGVKVYDVDIDREPELARTWRVATIPQAVLVDVKPDGKHAAELRRLVGVQSRQTIDRFLQEEK